MLGIARFQSQLRGKGDSDAKAANQLVTNKAGFNPNYVGRAIQTSVQASVTSTPTLNVSIPTTWEGRFRLPYRNC